MRSIHKFCNTSVYYYPLQKGEIRGEIAYNPKKEDLTYTLQDTSLGCPAVCEKTFANAHNTVTRFKEDFALLC